MQKKLWIYVICLYLIPTVLSVKLIINSEHLLGDFSSLSINLNIIDLIITASLYLLPILFIISVLKIFDCKPIFIKSINYIDYINYLYYLLLLLTILIFYFGGIPSGQTGSSDYVGLINVILMKINPMWILLIISTSNINFNKFIISIFCILILSYLLKSMIGYFIIYISVLNYWIIRFSPKVFVIILSVAIPVYLLDGGANSIIEEIYNIRNISRGLDIGSQVDYELGSRIMGRINSISSLYFIRLEDCCGDLVVDSAYALSIIMNRFTGINFFGNLSPSIIFNDYILGSQVENYAIFTSTTGALLILLKSGIIVTIFNIFIILLMIIFLFKITPLPSKSTRLPLFLTLLYLIYLSGDVWELSMILQSVLLINIIFILINKIYKLYIAN
jgi:hypothetical protein